MTTVLFAGACGGANDGAVSSDSDAHIRLEEELRIGGLMGDEEYTFGRVSAIGPAPDGTLYVGDAQVPIVRRYDRAGTHIGDIGRGGEGPGEFRSIDGLAVLDGQLIVWDSQNSRMSFFDTTGTFVTSFRVESGIGLWRGFGYGLNGNIFVVVPPEGGFVESPDGIQLDWMKVTVAGDQSRAGSRPDEDRTGPRFVLAGQGGYYRPFNVETVSAIGMDGSIYSVRNDVYDIRRVRPDGSESHILRDEPRIALTDDEQREWTARAESFARRRPEARTDYFPIPTIKPFIRELVVDPEGRLWVSRYTNAAYMPYSEEERAERAKNELPSYNWRDELRWDVFGPDDAFVGIVTLPFNTSFYTAIGDTVWGVQGGSFREDYVVRWRMIRDGES